MAAAARHVLIVLAGRQAPTGRHATQAAARKRAVTAAAWRNLPSRRSQNTKRSIPASESFSTRWSPRSASDRDRRPSLKDPQKFGAKLSFSAIFRPEAHRNGRYGMGWGRNGMGMGRMGACATTSAGRCPNPLGREFTFQVIARHACPTTSAATRSPSASRLGGGRVLKKGRGRSRFAPCGCGGQGVVAQKGLKDRAGRFILDQPARGG